MSLALAGLAVIVRRGPQGFTLGLRVKSRWDSNNQLLFDGVFSYSYDPEGNRTARFIDSNANGLLDAVILKRQVSTGWEKVCGFFADLASFLPASLRPGGFAALR